MLKKEKKSKKKLALINSMTLMLGLQLGLVSFILSTFLGKQVSEKGVGWLFLLAYLISFYILIKVHFLIKKYGKSQTFFMFVAVRWISLIGMGAFWFHPVSIVFAVFSLVGNAMLWSTLDVLLEEYSDNGTTGKTRGLFLVVLNTGFLVAPFISTSLIQNYKNGFQLVFYLASFFALIPMLILAVFFSERKYIQQKKKRNKLFFWKEVFNRKDILRIYLASFLLDLFYSVMVVYMPIYLLDVGLFWGEMGKIFTVMLIPFVLIQYPLGIIADKKTGEKEWLILALLLMALSTTCIGFIDVPQVGLWMMLLFLTRVGAAMVEVMRDTYFYKQVGPKEIEIMDFFRTTKSISYIFGMSFFSIILFFSNIESIFFVLGGIILLGTIPLFWLKDTDAFS